MTENINTGMFCVLKVAEKSGVPALFLSNPGAGKSTTVNLFAKIRGYEVVLLRGNSTTAEEVMGYDVAPREVSYDHKMAAISLRPSWFEEVIRNSQNGKKTLLFLDEITTANEFVQAALLHLIFERKVHNESLPEDTLIVSAGNYAQNLSNTMSLLPPVMNRFMIYNLIPGEKDLSIFLNKYTGGIAGKKEDYFKKLEEELRVLDEQEKEVTPEMMDSIGEYIERAIRDTTQRLMTQGEKPVDLTVTDLQNIYTDNEFDSKLCGFVSFRTLNYLRDVAINYYRCFGKSGIDSNIFRNLADGLCGIGVNRDSKRETKINYVGKEFSDVIIKTADILNRKWNSQVILYDKALRAVIIEKETEGKRSKPKSFTDEELGAIQGKLEEVKNDKDIATVANPVDEVILTSLCNRLKETGTELSCQKATSTSSTPITNNILSLLPSDRFVADIIRFNKITSIIIILKEFAKNQNFKYSDDMKKRIVSLIKDLSQTSFMLKNFKAIYIRQDSSLGDIIPKIIEYPQSTI